MMSTYHIKLWGDKRSHRTLYMIIYQKEKYIQVYIDYLIE